MVFDSRAQLERYLSPAHGKVVLFDHFTNQVTEAASPWILNSGTNGTAVDPAFNAQMGGVWRLTSGVDGGGFAADGSQMVGAVPWTANMGGLVFETKLHINTAITTVRVNAGLTDVTSLELPASINGTTVTTNLSDGCVFVYDTEQTTDQWYAIGVDTNTDATGNAITGVAPVADIWQVLRIEVDRDGVGASFFVNGTRVGRLTANATTPTVNLYPTVIVSSTTTTSRLVDVDYILVEAFDNY